MKTISCRSGVFVTMLFAVIWSTGCGRSDLLAGPDDEPVNAGGATATVASSSGGRSGVVLSSSQGQAGAGGGNGGAANSSTIASKPLGGSAGFAGNGGSSRLSSSSSKPIAGASGGSGGLSSLAGSKTSGGAGAIGGSGAVGGVSALAGSKTSGGAGAIGGSGGVSALAGSKASGGSSTTGGSTGRCSDAKGCGGDVVGTWNVTSSCLSATGQVDLSMLGLGCKSVAIDESLNVTGTWVAMADGTYVDRTTTKGSVQFAVPASCLRISGTTASCSVVPPVFEALGYTSMTCKDAAGGGCTCATAVTQIGGLGVIAESALTRGAYKTSGNVLTLDGTNRYAYCVSGTQLTLSPQGTNPPATGSIVFQKQ